MRQWLFRVLEGRDMTRWASVPGPAPTFPLGNGGDFIGSRWPWEVCADYAKQYGGLTLVWFFGRPALVLNDPALIGEVLDTRWQDFYKRGPVEALRPVITPQSLFITNLGHGWETARRENPLTQAGPDAWLDKQVAPLREEITAFVRSRVEAAKPVDLYWDTQQLMFDAFSRAFWGETFSPDRFDWFQTLAREGTRRMGRPFQYLPAINPFFLSARKKWYAAFTERVRHARANPKPGTADLLHATIAQCGAMPDEALAESLATNYFGGVFSCASTVNTTLYLLAKHPGELDIVRQAVRQDLGGGYDRTALDACRPLEFAVREAMRFYPAVPIYFRNSAIDREVKLGSHTLPPDTLLMISNWHLHTHSPHWGDPEAFRPARWDHGGLDANPFGSGHFFPFGRGPRACIGSEFARLVNKIALATILNESDPTLDGDPAYWQHFFFGVMMPKGLTARFAAR